MTALELSRATILVTGGAGFIGSHLVERLVASGCRVINLDLLTYAGHLQNVAAAADHERHVFVHGDIGDRQLVNSLLAEHQPTLVMNIAAETHVDRSIDDAAAFIRTNVTGVFQLLEASLGYWRGLGAQERDQFRFVQMSTDEVYGSVSEGVFTEESAYAPSSPYAASKASGDHMVRAYGVTFGLPVVVVHASNTYGPRQYPEKLIPHMIACALGGRPLPIYGDGLNVRDWLHVGDLVRGLECVAREGEPGQTYNFAGGEEARNIDTVRSICTHLDRAVPAARTYGSAITFVRDRPGHDGRYAMSIDKVRRVFGWQSQIRFTDGLRETVDWYLANATWRRSIADRGYLAQRIGLGAS